MKSTKKIWALVAALTLCSAGAFAQDQKQDTPPVDYNTPLQPLEPTPAGGYASKAPIGAARGVSAPSDSPDVRSIAGHAGPEYPCGSRAFHAGIAAALQEYF